MNLVPDMYPHKFVQKYPIPPWKAFLERIILILFYGGRDGGETMKPLFLLNFLIACNK